MFFSLKDNNAQKRLDEIEIKFKEVVKQLNEMADKVTKCEIISLEGRKLYHKKLMDLYGKEIDKGEGKDIYNGVLSV